MYNIEELKKKIGKNIIVDGRKHKLVNVRDIGSMILVYYEINDTLARNKEGVCNANIVRFE